MIANLLKPDERILYKDAFKSAGGSELAWSYFSNAHVDEIAPSPSDWTKEEWRQIVEGAASLTARKKEFREFQGDLAELAARVRHSRSRTVNGTTARVRLHKLARDLGVASNEVVRAAQQLGIGVSSHSSSVTSSEARAVEAAVRSASRVN